MPTYTALQKKQTDLIRKATTGSFFLAPGNADPIVDLTQSTSGKIELKPLPSLYEDLGWVNADGFQFGREVANSEITSFGSTTPTRSDVRSDVTSFTVNAQETKALTISLYTGADLAAIKANATTGEVKLVKPAKPASRNYRGLAIGVDENAYGEIYMARYFGNLKVTGYGAETWSNGDEALLRSVTFGTNPDSLTGSAETWFFGGPGWHGLLDEMGIQTTV